MKLFEPGTIGNITIKNRIVMAPMGMGRIAEPDGRWGERVLEYYVTRARGETGLIITGVAPVTRKLEPMWQTHIDFHNLAHMESLRALAKAVHSSGAKIFIQLTAGFGRVVSAEAVILATGATPIIPDIPGIRGENVITAVNLLLGRGKLGEKVIVLGGGLVGCETALYLAEKGKKVTILKRTDTLLPNMYHANRGHLLLLLSQHKVNIITGLQIEEVTGHGVIISKKGEKENLKADTIVVSLGLEPRRELVMALQEKIPEFHIVGDCAEPRYMINAIWEGFHAARSI